MVLLEVSSFVVESVFEIHCSTEALYR
jgi:hypothetical protein